MSFAEMQTNPTISCSWLVIQFADRLKLQGWGILVGRQDSSGPTMSVEYYYVSFNQILQLVWFVTNISTEVLEKRWFFAIIIMSPGDYWYYSIKLNKQPMRFWYPFFKKIVNYNMSYLQKISKTICEMIFRSISFYF